MISGIDEKTGQPLGLTRMPKKTLGKEDFIILFVKQLQYQDPMKPIDNNEMATQLALFTQVDQLFDLNTKLENFIQSNKEIEFLNIANLIGKVVKIKGNTGVVEKGSFLGAEIELSEPSNQVEVIITDQDGNIIRKLDLGALSQGIHPIAWDGKDEKSNQVADGIYYIKVKTDNPSNKPTLYVNARVTAAILGDKDIKLTVNNKDQINLTDIIELKNNKSISDKEVQE